VSLLPEHVAAPLPPSPAPPYSFPVLATLAPVAVSLALWAITASVFALVFAALGPAVALASLADARVQSRRRSRREKSRFASDLEAARSEITAAHAREVAELAASSPSARRLVGGQWPVSEQWLCEPGGEIAVCVGWGERASSLVLDGAAVVDRGRGDAHEAVRRLARDAARLRDAPVVLDARLGIGVLGRAPLASAVARGIVIQVLAAVSPVGHELTIETCDAEEWRWLLEAPHEVRDPPAGQAARPPSGRADVRGTVLRISGAGADAREPIVISVAESRDELPRRARIVVEAAPTGARVVQHPDRSQLRDIRLDPVSRQQAVSVVRALAAHAGAAGIAGAAATPPPSVSFAECASGGFPSRDPSAGAGLDCVAAVTAHGPLHLDLVAQGPHAIVGGTTGSGKSELLIGWVLAMARAHSPLDVSVLLVDFKGGSAFASLVGLPHCVGMITDLDEEGATRALESLAAELRRRERHLAAGGAKSIDALDPGSKLPRLVIMVDEFAAMVGGYPELHALFTDIAARGRSLGVHLVLCTQRPAGVIRDGVLANSGLRLSLRVNNRADSMAVIGTDAASTLPVEPHGRAWVAADGAEAVLAQFPLVTPEDVDGVRRRWSDHPYRPHRPWLDPLPVVLPLESLRRHPADGDVSDADDREVSEGGVALAFGLLDDPAEQAQPLAVYRPLEHGNLLVVGGGGSGKSTLLSTLVASARATAPRSAEPIARRVPADIEAAWDVLTETLEAIRAPSVEPDGRRLLLIDDLDALLPRFPDEYGGEVLEVLGAILREGPARGIHCVVTAQRLTAGLHPIAALCGSRIHLRMPSRQELVLAGGDGASFADRLPAGAGHWRGLRLQVAVTNAAAATNGTSVGIHSGTAEERLEPSASVLGLEHPLAVVSRHPRRFVERLRRDFPRLAADHAIVEIGAVAAPGVSVSTGARGLAIVGDADAWQAHWGALGALRGTHTIVVEGYGAAEFRTITRERALPPPLAPGGPSFWALSPGEAARRVALPTHSGQ
jgi:S-DNA-T family DNA segregation ATPase FtsK/SpoIIIE